VQPGAEQRTGRGAALHCNSNPAHELPYRELEIVRLIDEYKKKHPGAVVITYVNSSAEVKAQTDICCTSANAVRVVQSRPEDRIIFVPDRNLALYAARFTEKEILPWEGYCIVHDRYTPNEARAARARYPGAELIVHPECRPEVIDLADVRDHAHAEDIRLGAVWGGWGACRHKHRCQHKYRNC
jgi:quinolinate synthetase A subunit